MTTNQMDFIFDVYQNHGHANYGLEAVSQLEHALQIATLAKEAGESDSMILACLLHDLGHLLDQENPEIDGHHEIKAAAFLKNSFDTSVINPIKLHVAAKRYLCHADPLYFDSLSYASKKSLELQGGVFTPEECREFLSQEYAQEAIRLRKYDDLAKVPNKKTASFEDFFKLSKTLQIN
jgi:phosphonate degradation associated HDIG domain protein